MIILDSGLGGISVVRALCAAQPMPALIYAADTSGFPYGARSAEEITARAAGMVRSLLSLYPQSQVVIACNTLSTLCLDALRAMFSVPFVGTVPAIKTAASLSKTRRFTLLATPNTANSRYSSDLIAQFGGDCIVDIYGAPDLAIMVEAMLLGQPVSDDEIRRELLPAFCDDGFGRTDYVVLGCTHYTLIVDALRRVAPWPVMFIDSSAAIARRVLSLADHPPAYSIAYVTAESDIALYRDVFLREGFDEVRALRIS